MASVVGGSNGSQILGGKPEHVWVLMAGFCQFEGDAEQTWSTSARLEKEFTEYLVNERNIPRKQVVCLTDDLGTLDNIWRGVDKICAEATDGDVFLFYWGSHGSLETPGDSSTFQLKSYDRWVRGKDIVNRIVARFPSTGKILLLPDCCYSGSLASIVEKTQGKPNTLKFAVLSSTSPYQTAWSKWRFCRVVLDAVRGCEKTAEGLEETTLESLHRFVCTEMSFICGGHPELYIEEGFGNTTLHKVCVETQSPWHGNRVVIDGKRKGVVIGGNDTDVFKVRLAHKDWNDEGELISTVRCQSYEQACEAGSNSAFSTIPVGSSVLMKWWSNWKNSVPGVVVDVCAGLHKVERKAGSIESLREPIGDLWVSRECLQISSVVTAADIMSFDSVEVAGAGVEFINGVYSKMSMFNSRPCFENSETSIQMWWNHGSWRIGKTNDYYYYSEDENPLNGAKFKVWDGDSQYLNENAVETAPPFVQKVAADIMLFDSVEVAGAGVEFINGVYSKMSMFNSRPCFENSETSIQMWWNHGSWRIGKTNDYYYYSEDENPLNGAKFKVWDGDSQYLNENAVDTAPPNVKRT